MSSSRCVASIAVPALVLAVLLAALACSQQDGVALSGFVQDPSGSRIPRAVVLITDAEREVTEATTAGADGSFGIESLARSPSYQIEVHGPAEFERHVRRLDLSEDLHLEVTLGIKPIVEAIVISGARPIPESGQSNSPRRRIRVGGDVRKARLVHFVPPIYPPEAEREGVEGTVLMEGVIGKEGRLIGLSTLNSMVDERLAAAASDALLLWQYEPTLLNGRPFEVDVTISLAFELP